MPEAVGQLNMYLNYYENEVNDEGDNKPIGIILCTDKDALAVEYALGGLSSNIFASKYTYYIPDKEQLIAEVEKVINQWNSDSFVAFCEWISEETVGMVCTAAL